MRTLSYCTVSGIQVHISTVSGVSDWIGLYCKWCMYYIVSTVSSVSLSIVSGRSNVIILLAP